MLDIKVSNQGVLNSNEFCVPTVIGRNQNDDAESIFSKNANDTVSEKNAEILNEQLRKVRDNNGCFSSLWNKIKIEADIGISDKKCDEIIELYKNGEIEFEEADEKIKEFSIKQKEGVNLLSTIFASVAALGGTALVSGAIAALAGPFAWLGFAVAGGCIGAFAKAGFKTLDRATNNIENDEFDLKQISKDFLSGAVAGSIATVTMGTASSATSVTNAIVNCGKVGVKSGAVGCGANYAIDTALEEEKEFNIADFALTTAEGAAVGTVVGSFMGLANATMHSIGALKSGCSFNTFIANAGNNTTRDFVANSVCTTEYKILNDRITSAYK